MGVTWRFRDAAPSDAAIGTASSSVGAAALIDDSGGTAVYCIDCGSMGSSFSGSKGSKLAADAFGVF